MAGHVARMEESHLVSSFQGKDNGVAFFEVIKDQPSENNSESQWT